MGFLSTLGGLKSLLLMGGICGCGWERTTASVGKNDV